MGKHFRNVGVAALLAWQRYRYYLNEPKINNLLGEHDSQVTVVDGRAYGLNPQYGVVYVLPIRNLGGSHVKIHDW